MLFQFERAWLARALCCAAALAVVGCGSKAQSSATATGGAPSASGGFGVGGAGGLGAGGAAGAGGSLVRSGGASASGGTAARAGATATGGPASTGGLPGKGGVPATGGTLGTGGRTGSGGTTRVGGASGAGGRTGGGGTTGNPDAGCVALVTDPKINWREGSLKSDQEIVECLAQTLGRPVGYGEKALGGYNPAGGSTLVVINKSGSPSVEQQLAQAIAGNGHAWIVFDKADFAQAYEIGMYRLHCGDAGVQARLGATEAECLDYRRWCQRQGLTGDAECQEQFFNVALNDGALPIRNPVIGSHKTIDGRMSRAYFRFSGFAIGADSEGDPTQTAESVILTHLRFEGAGHTEDHELDPDMIRSTGASHDIWIHKNDFDLTGDSAFDVKVGAHNVTMSFNLVKNVLRATLHGSSDSRVINQQITTTMHDNAFVTTDEYYKTMGNTGRRVPLIRRGTSHMWNNVFVNYRKDVLSIRVGAQVLWQDNALVVNQSLQEKSTVEASLGELSGNLLRDITDGSFRGEGTSLWFSDDACNVDASTLTVLNPSSGNVADLASAYSQASRDALAAQRLPVGQKLIDYVMATAGRDGALPFNSPLALDVAGVLALGKVPCQ